MKATHLLVIVVGLTTFGGGLAAGLDHLATNPKLSAPLSTIADSLRANDHGDGHTGDHSALRQEIASLGAELRAVKDGDRGTNTSNDELLSVKKEIAALQEQLALIAGTIENLTGTDDSEANGFVPSTNEDMDLTLMDQTYDEEERRRRLGDKFDVQSVDTIWSQDAAAVVIEAFHNEQLTRSDVDGIECRASLCRVYVSHADPAAANKFEILFPIQVAGTLPQIRYFTEQQDDGRSVTVMYLAREGYGLPVDDQ